jgi:nucleoid-associated protein YgaU
VHPDDLECVAGVYKKILASPGVRVDLRFRFWTANGSWRHLEAVAENLLDDKGADAWPTCGLLAGLGGDTGDAGVDTGVSESPGTDGIPGDTSDGTSDEPGASLPTSSDGSATDSPDSTDSAAEAGDTGDSGGPDEAGASPAPGGSADTTQRDDSDKSGQSGAASADPETGGTGTGRHRGTGADEAGASVGDGREDGSSGRHASRDADAARDAVDGTYTVRTGDNLWAIADSLDLQGGWHGLYAANRETVGDDPDLILPGQKLAVQDESVEK